MKLYDNKNDEYYKEKIPKKWFCKRLNKEVNVDNKEFNLGWLCDCGEWVYDSNKDHNVILWNYRVCKNFDDKDIKKIIKKVSYEKRLEKIGNKKYLFEICKDCEFKIYCDNVPDHPYSNPVYHGCSIFKYFRDKIIGGGSKYNELLPECVKCGEETKREILGIYICEKCYTYKDDDKIVFTEKIVRDCGFFKSVDTNFNLMICKDCRRINFCKKIVLKDKEKIVGGLI